MLLKVKIGIFVLLLEKYSFLFFCAFVTNLMELIFEDISLKFILADNIRKLSFQSKLGFGIGKTKRVSNICHMILTEI